MGIYEEKIVTVKLSRPCPFSEFVRDGAFTVITNFHGESHPQWLLFDLSERLADDGPKLRKSARSRHLRHEGRTDAPINTITVDRFSILKLGSSIPDFIKFIGRNLFPTTLSILENNIIAIERAGSTVNDGVHCGPITSTDFLVKEIQGFITEVITILEFNSGFVSVFSPERFQSRKS